MNIAPLTPTALKAALAADPALIYLDVRTVAEFVSGRPQGRAANVPWEFYHPTTGAVVPNTSFLEVMAAHFPPATPLVVGCADETRASAAAHALGVAGYQNLRILAGGYQAWRAQGLMFSTDNRPGVSYVSLLMQAKRAGKVSAPGH